MSDEMPLPRTAGSVIEAESGVWFVLYPPDGEDEKWEWRSSGGDLFLSEFDSVKRYVANARSWTEDAFGKAPYTVGSVDSPTVTYAAWVRKALNHLGDILVGKSAR